MRRAWLAIVLGGAAAAAAQVQIQAPGMRTPTGHGHHGTPQPVELSEVAIGGYVRRVVQTRGTLTPLEPGDQFFELSEGGRVVIMSAGELGDALASFNGRRIEVVGLVRPLVESQGTCVVPDPRAAGGRQRAPQSLCDDPDLPPTPDLVGARANWPRTSITVWSASDITPFGRGRRGVESSTLMDLLGETTPSDKPVRLVGRFCGANLCGGLGPRPHPSAWVLQDEDAAVWVIGKDPKGKGWRLDPGYKGDTSRWIEVVGSVEPCGKTRCLKAKSVALVPRPADSASPAP
jgi:hypothetical protein